PALLRMRLRIHVARRLRRHAFCSVQVPEVHAMTTKTKPRTKSRKTSNNTSGGGQRPVWTGFLRLSLVSVPVKAFTANAPGHGEVHLHQIHKTCHSRIKYQKTCP